MSLTRKFEEAGNVIDGVSYGLHDGSAEWDSDGSLETLHVKAQGLGRGPLILDIDDLIRERAALNAKYPGGITDIAGFLSKERAFLQKWSLFWGLHGSLSDTYQDDLEEMKDDARHREYEAAE